MTSEKIFAIGVMSGTSLDGLDICYAVFQKDAYWYYEILHAKTLPYPKIWEEKLRQSIALNAEDLFALNSEYGFYLGEKIAEFINKNKIKNLDLIASHGHTIFHQPHRKFTTQIGDGRAIKILNNYPVVYDFRSQDVLMGGNGAPLVPFGDQLLFSEYDACINLGGFSNISLVHQQKRIAFDICPMNIVLNQSAMALGKKYDSGGKIARSGTVHIEILEKLNQLTYYQQNFPKSLGIEWVQKFVEPLLKNMAPQDSLATITAHSAVQIATALEQFSIKKALFTGGGAYNDFLIEKIKERTDAEIIIPEKHIIEFKEALIFAFMGVLRLRNENNVLASATGSTRDHCSGLLV